MNKLRKVSSFFYPQIIKKATSAISGKLEVRLVNGKVVLDAENTNYSFGGDEKVMAIGLSKINLDENADVLLLGLGAGCALNCIENRFKFPPKNITAIEIDSLVIDLAKEYFDVEKFKRLTIVQTDAYEFVKGKSKPFNLIIIDVFIDNKVPDRFLSQEFIKNIISLLKTNGSIIFNTILSEKQKDEISAIFQSFAEEIKIRKFSNVLGNNTLFIGTKN